MTPKPKAEETLKACCVEDCCARWSNNRAEVPIPVIADEAQRCPNRRTPAKDEGENCPKCGCKLDGRYCWKCARMQPKPTAPADEEGGITNSKLPAPTMQETIDKLTEYMDSWKGKPNPYRHNVISNLSHTRRRLELIRRDYEAIRRHRDDLLRVLKCKDIPDYWPELREVADLLGLGSLKHGDMVIQAVATLQAALAEKETELVLAHSEMTGMANDPCDFCAEKDKEIEELKGSLYAQAGPAPPMGSKGEKMAWYSRRKEYTDLQAKLKSAEAVVEAANQLDISPCPEGCGIIQYEDDGSLKAALSAHDKEGE